MTATSRSAVTRRGVPVDPNLRILALSQFAHRFAGGALLSTSALYFTRHQGLTATEVGAALSLAALVGLLVAVPAGQLADAKGPTSVLVWTTVGTACTAWPPAFASSPLALTVLLSLQALFHSSSSAVQQGVVARVATGGAGVGFRAYLRAVTNVGLALGSLVGGLALVHDERWTYVSIFFAQAVLTGLAAWNVSRLPILPAHVRPYGEPRLLVLRDRPYVALTALHLVFATHFFVIEVGLVLFIVERTTAPAALIAGTLVLNTLLVAALQVRLTSRITTVPEGSRALRRAGLLIAAGFVLIGSAEDLSVTAACGLLLAGTLVHGVGEILGSGGQWSHQMGLAPHERQGQYQGFASLSVGGASVIGPLVAAFCCVELGRVGWMALAVVMLSTAMAMGPVARWALGSRARYGVTSHSG